MNRLLKNWKNYISVGGAQIVSLVQQLIFNGGLLYFVTEDEYSSFLQLLLISGLFSFADLGTSVVVGNRFAMNDKDCSEKTLAAVLIYFFILVTAFSVVALVVFQVYHENSADSGLTFVLLGLLSGSTVIQNLVLSVYRKVNLNHVGMIWVTGVRIFALVAGGVSLYQMKSIDWFLFPLVFVNVFGLVFVLNRHVSVLQYLRGVFTREVFEIFIGEVKLGAYYLIFPLAYWIQFSAQSLVVGAMAGPKIMVLFNVTRSYSRLLAIVGENIKQSVWPLILTHANSKRSDLIRIISVNRLFLVLLSFSLGGVMFLFGEVFMKYWTNGAVTFHYGLALGFFIAILVNSVWFVDSAYFQALNKHKAYALTYLSSTLTALAAVFVLGAFDNVALLGIGLVFHELVMLVFCRIKLKGVER